MKSKYRDKIAGLGFLILIFLCVYIFFSIIHPLYIYDTDDWTYISYVRHAVADIHEWNPTKVLPETLMPFCAQIALWIINPLIDDYIESMAIAFAVFMALLIAVYLAFWIRYLILSNKLNINEAIVCSFLLFLFSFFLFKESANGKRYMFWADNVTCMFNYIVPGLVNSITVLYLMTIKIHSLSGYPLKQGTLIFIVYLCINSNMFHSIILIALVCTNLLLLLYTKCRESKQNLCKTWIIVYIKENFFWLSVLFVWFISLYFEANGGRAAWNTFDTSRLPVMETVLNLFHALQQMNPWFWAAMLFFMAAGLGIWSIKKDKQEIDFRFIDNSVKLLICLTITTIYLILLCAKVNPSYIAGSKVLFAVIFYAMTLAFTSLSYALKNCRKLLWVFPCLLYILVIENITSSYAQCNIPGLNEKIVKTIDNDIITQIVAADNEGLSEVDVYVPKHANSEWPLAVSYGGARISRTLYRHGLTSRPIEVHLIPDESKNIKFKIP